MQQQASAPRQEGSLDNRSNEEPNPQATAEKPIEKRRDSRRTQNRRIKEILKPDG